MKLEIQSISNLGHGVAFNNQGKKIFVPKAVPGDIIDARTIQEKGKYCVAEIATIITPSKHRKIPECKYFSICGGCLLQHLENSFYIEFKQKNIKESLARSGISVDKEVGFLDIGKEERRRIYLHVDKKNNLGLYKENSNDLVAIDSCLVVTNKINSVISKLQNLLKLIPHGLIKDISICEFDNIIDIVLKLRNGVNITPLKSLLVEFSRENRVNISYKNNKEIIDVNICRIPQLMIGEALIDVSSEIFMQATKKGQDAIISIILDFIKTHNITKVVDLFSGVGTYSFAMSKIKNITHITAIEAISTMVDIIESNSKKVKLGNKVVAKIKDLHSNPIKLDELNIYDLAIVNPPRNGAKAQIKQLIKSNIKNVIMVSCSANSFVQDSKILVENGFKIENITLIDQFYYTSHIELVAIFTK